MSTADKLNRVMQSKNEIRQAIIEKGVEVPEDTKLRDYPSKIASIRTVTDYFEELLRIRTNDWTDGTYLFTKSNVKEFDLNGIDFSKMKIMYGMFANCTSMASAPEIDTSSATTLAYMFQNCSSLTTIPLFNTSNVTNMSYTFYNCTKLTKIPALDLNKVTTFTSMFTNCTSLVEVDSTLNTLAINKKIAAVLPNRSSVSKGKFIVDYGSLDDALKNTLSSKNWEVDTTYPLEIKTSDTTGIIRVCTDIGSEYVTEVNVADMPTKLDKDGSIIRYYDSHDIVAVTMSGMTNLIEIVNYKMPKKVLYTGYIQLFNKCTNLTTIRNLDLSNHKVLSELFSGCTSLTTLPEEIDFNNATTISNIFNGCTSLTTLPKLVNTSNVTNMLKLFYGCGQLTSIPELDTSSVTIMYQMFYGCNNLTGIADPDKFWNNSKVTNHFQCFKGCTKLDNYADIPDDWK